MPEGMSCWAASIPVNKTAATQRMLALYALPLTRVRGSEAKCHKGIVKKLPAQPRRVSAGKKARIFASMRKLWQRMPQVHGSAKMLEEDRNR
jgi:hypothetical protein